jgi:ankyrin repeat protein
MLNRIFNFYQQPANKPEHPLFAAAESGNLSAISKMMDYFPDLEMKDSSDNTPLIMAASTGQLAAMRILLNHDARLDTKGNNGFTALNVAASNGQAEAAALLISYGANLESQTDSGHTPLWNAVDHSHENVVRLLTAVGADVNCKDQSSHTVLMYAVVRGCRNIVGMLLQAGAKPDLAAKNGVTAEAIAAARSRFDMIELLRMDRFALANLSFHLQAMRDMDGIPKLAAVQLPVAEVEQVVEAVETEEVELPAVERDESEPDEEKFLERYICPISQDVMQDPLTLPSGFTFDREPLRDYVASQGNPETFACPMSRKPIPIAALTYDTNIMIKQEIEERRKQLEDKKQEREERAKLQDLRNKRVQYYQGQGLFAVHKPAQEVPLPPSPGMRR